MSETEQHDALLVDVLHGVEVQAVVVKNQEELVVERPTERFPLQHPLQFFQKHEGRLDGRDILERRIDVHQDLLLELDHVLVEHLIPTKNKPTFGTDASQQIVPTTALRDLLTVTTHVWSK